MGEKCYSVHVLYKQMRGNIVNWGDWLGSPENIKVTNKDAKIYVGRSTILHNLLFCVHTLCMSYVTRFLVPHYGLNNYCVMCRVKAKKANKNIQHWTLTSFMTIPVFLLWYKARGKQLFFIKLFLTTVVPRYNEPRYNEDPVITNNIWKPGRITVKYGETNPAITNPAIMKSPLYRIDFDGPNAQFTPL